MTPMARPKKIPDPDKPEHDYLLKGVPLDLWLDCQAKAVREQVSMKQVLVMMLRAWVGA